MDKRINMAEETKKLSTKASFARGAVPSLYPNTLGVNPWATMVDKLSFGDHNEYENIVRDCRFYFRHDPLASTVIRKMVDITISELIVDYSSSSTKTEKAIFDALEKDVIAFLRKAAYEFLITGLLVPEIKLTRINKSALRERHIPRISSLLYPTSMWIRDSKDVEIRRPLITEKESYFLKIPDEAIFFIENKGEYADGGRDLELYKEIIRMYPEFVQQVLNGQTVVLLDNPLVIKDVSLPDNAYPIPYMYPALEALKHKRNLRRMDYSIAARVISAILLVRAGNDDFPLTEDQEDVLDELEEKFKWRQNLSADDLERVFALFTNHTIEIEWIFPEVTALLDNEKYQTVNQDIMVALGFPRILITGETERSFASDPQIATISPIHTMYRIQKQLLPIAEKLYLEMQRNNKVISQYPKIKFNPITVMSLSLLYEGIAELYNTGNISRRAYAEAYGYDIRVEFEQRKEEADVIEELGISEFAPVPFSEEPGAEDAGRPKKAPESKGKTPAKK